MKLVIEKIKENPVTLLRRAGYVFQRHQKDEMSFIRPLARAGFPRFHAYAYLQGTDLTINIHFDQKKETYGQNTRHHGEYDEDSEVLLKEIEYLKSVLK